MIWLWLIPSLVLLGGVTLLWLGLRGRRVDDHPICRRCGFDLFGRPEGSNICSECGGDLTKRHAIGAGQRVRRGGMIALGVFMLALGLSLGGGAGYATYTFTDWQRAKPVWWLVREIDHGDPKTQSAAITEVIGRLANRRLSQSQINSIADTMLDLQADSKKPWLGGCGDFIEGARDTKQLSDARWQRYAEHAITFALEVRPWIRRGDPIPFQIRSSGTGRAGSRSNIRVLPPASALVGDERFNGPFWGLPRDPFATVPTFFPASVAANNYHNRLGDGALNLRVMLDANIARRPGNALPLPAVELNAQFNLFPAHESTVLVTHDDSLRERMRRAVSVSIQRSWQQPDQLLVSIKCNNPPAGIGHAVAISHSGELTPVGTIACPAKETRQFALTCDAKGISDLPLTARFYPTPAAAAASTDTFEIWNGMFEITNVRAPSVRQIPAQRPQAPVTRPRK